MGFRSPRPSRKRLSYSNRLGDRSQALMHANRGRLDIRLSKPQHKDGQMQGCNALSQWAAGGTNRLPSRTPRASEPLQESHLSHTSTAPLVVSAHPQSPQYSHSQTHRHKIMDPTRQGVKASRRTAHSDLDSSEAHRVSHGARHTVSRCGAVIQAAVPMPYGARSRHWQRLLSVYLCYHLLPGIGRESGICSRAP